MSQQATEMQNTSTLTASAMEICMKTPRIYVASLSDYNNSILHGVWIDATQDYDIVMEQISAMLACSPATKIYGDIAEEFAIHDYEFFQGIELSESESIEKVVELAQAIEEHGEAFAAFYQNLGFKYTDTAGIVAEYQEAFCGVYESEEAFGTEIADEAMPSDAPEFLITYFDYEAYTRDLFLDGYYSLEISNGYAIFHN